MDVHAFSSPREISKLCSAREQNSPVLVNSGTCFALIVMEERGD